MERKRWKETAQVWKKERAKVWDRDRDRGTGCVGMRMEILYTYTIQYIPAFLSSSPPRSTSVLSAVMTIHWDCKQSSSNTTKCSSDDPQY